MIFDSKINILYKLAEENLISGSDINLAEFLCWIEKNPLSDNEKQTLAAVSALVSEWVSAESICLTKNDIETFIKTNKETFSEIAFPDWEEIKNVMAKSSCCTLDPENENKPLVLADEKIYFYKYWLYENSLAAKVLKISEDKGKYADKADEIKVVLEKLFDEDEKKYGKKNTEQQQAAETVIKHRFSVITGGPGTGKTTTVAKIIAGILSIFPEERIILAAPTGKAAARITEALTAATEKMEESNITGNAEIIEKIKSIEGLTIHRILGKKFGRPEKNRENPIYADLIIVDEASMVDIAMFSELLDAIIEETSLILLGDKDQLASVDVGNVLSDICASRELLPEGTVSELKISHRFEQHPAIGRLAEAVNGQKDANEVIKICKEEQDLDFTFQTVQKIAETSARKYGFLSDTNLKPEEILDKLNDFKVLCPSKEDPFGVDNINREIENALKIDRSDVFYNGRPIMITKNDYINDLMNGDCGVILKRSGITKVWFKQGKNVRSFTISELSAFETVYAMTIHKSQGSEYDSVLVVLPERDIPMLTKELLYTAITRAREKVEISAKESVLEYTLKNSAARNSGFKEALIKAGTAL